MNNIAPNSGSLSIFILKNKIKKVEFWLLLKKKKLKTVFLELAVVCAIYVIQPYHGTYMYHSAVSQTYQPYYFCILPQYIPDRIGVGYVSNTDTCWPILEYWGFRT
jgi:hypothetical protein